MARTAVIWIAGSTAVIIAGFVLATVAPTAGTVVVVAGILALTGFLLYAWRVATTREDQWVWQTPGKPRREYLAEQASKRESEPTGDDPDTKA